MTTSPPAAGIVDRAGAVTALVDGWAASKPAALAILAVLALASFLPGFASIPPIDGDEPRTAVAARQMVASGDYASVRLETVAANDSPRGGFWVDAAALVLSRAGDAAPIRVYRLPSLAGGLVTVMLTWWLALAFARPRAALLAGALVAVAGILGLQARLAAPDALFAACMTLAAGSVARLWREGDRADDRRMAAVFWIAVAFGFLLKGPLAPAIAGAAIAVLSVERGGTVWLRRLKPPVWGVAVALVVGLSWPVAAAIGSAAGAGAPPVEVLTRLGVAFDVLAPPGTYLLLSLLLAGPMMTFILTAAPWIADNARRPPILFALAWGGPVWLAAELWPTKLPQHVLPAIPAIALIAAVAIDAGGPRIAGRISWFFSLGPVFWPPVLAVTFPVVFLLIEGRVPYLASVAFLAAAVLGPIAWVWLRRAQTVAAASAAIVSSLLILFGFFGGIVPGFTGLRASERVAALLAETVPCPDPQVVAAGYPEETLVFTVGSRVTFRDAAGAADFLNGEGCRAAVVDTGQISSFRQRADDLGLDLLDRGRVGGVNTRKLRRIGLHVFTVEVPAG
jgi:4-amino-4-deoxy-L-arabinose transferase-like glycosyltransferase